MQADTTTLAPTDADLARLRFFRDLTGDERMKVLRVFGAIPLGAESEVTSHYIERRLFDRMLAKWGAPAPASGGPVAAVISHVDADGNTKHPFQLWGEYSSKIESLEREAAWLRQRMSKYESSAPTKAFAALTYYRDQVCDDDGPTTKEFHRLLADALSAPPAQEVRVPLTYRLLVRGIDKLEAEDEFLQDDAQTWAIDPNAIFKGMPYHGGALRPARRIVYHGITAAQKESK